MASLLYFTVTGTYLAALKDSLYDVDNDPELTPMSGTVTFTPLIDPGDSLPAPTLTPPANLWLVPVKAQIRSGAITTNGATGVKLVANTAVLGLEGDLFYRVDFYDGLLAGGKTYHPDSFVFQAPTSATTIDLVSVTPVAGQPAQGSVPSSAVSSVAGKTGAVIITADDINGATTVGKSVLAAADTAAAWAAVKPSAGVAKTELSSSVQTSLGKADTAYQAPAVVAAGATQADARTAIGAPSTAEMSSAIATATGAADRVAAQGIVEFRWILPTSLYLAEPYRHTLLAALGNSNGATTPLLVVDVSHESNTTQTYQIGTVQADDHCAPSIITAPGDPILVQWTTHGLDNLMRYRVGMPDRPDTLVTAPDQTADMGAITSYGQAWKVNSLSDDTKVTYYRLYRRNLVEWYLLKEEVNRSTLQVTTNAPGTKLYSSTGLQCYLTTATGAKDAQKIRIAAGTSPASEPDWVLWFEIDLATGAITTPLDGTFTANLNGTNLPITPNAVKTQLLPSLSGSKAAYERRLLAARPWPAAMGVLTAEADPNSRASTAHYWLHEWGGAYTGVTTGSPTASTGLICPNGSPSYAHTTDVPLAANATSVQLTMKVKLPATLPADAYIDLGGQQNADSDGWYLWLGGATNTLKLRMGVNRVGGFSNLTSTTALAGGATWGSTVWIRANYHPTAIGGFRCVMESSLDGSTWTNIGNIAGNSGAMLVDSSAYTWIGARAMGRASGIVVMYSKIEINGTTESELDFTSDTGIGWPGYTLTHSEGSPQSNAWDLLGAATVGRTAYGPTQPSVAIPVSNDLGAVGDSLWASYYPGAAFSGASVILARTNGANQQLVVSDFATGSLRETVLRTQPTTAGRYFRPMPPDNGGPLWCWLVNATSYGTNEFYEWVSSAIAVRRI